MPTRILFTLLVALASLKVQAEVKLPILNVNGDVYSNVTVTSVTATDIYFTHSQGLGNAKLKRLSPELQARFGFSAAKAGLVEGRQAESNARYRAEVDKQPVSKSTTAGQSAAEASSAPDAGEGDIVAPKLYAKSVRGQRPPQIVVDHWVSATPDVAGKWVLVDFWATWCGPCRASIPHLNTLQDKFKDKLVVIGLSSETEEEVKKMEQPVIRYSVGVDPRGRTSQALEVTGIPHAILIDPSGIVRFEGMPGYLDEAGLTRLMAKYPAREN
jgi:thiol-disulfide isomerase/thioredoxin